MTFPEFQIGYRLLLLQPWAHRYKAKTPAGDLTGDALAQADFYWDAVKAFPAGPWHSVCASHAQGNEWPSIDTLKRAVRMALPPTPPPTEGITYTTLDEFGLDLFEAIQAKAAGRDEDVQALLKKGTIAPEDVRRLLTITPSSYGGRHAKP